MAIGKALETLGASPVVRRHGGNPPREFSEEERAAVLALLAQGATMSDAARQVWPDTPFNTSRKWSRRIAQEAGMGGGVGNSTPEVHKLSPGDNFVIPRSAPLAPAVPAWAREDDEPEVFRIPKGDPKRYDLFPRLEGDYLVWSDPHAPFHDDEFMTLSIKKAHRLGIQDLIIAGDLMDGNQFSKRGLHIGHQRRWQDDAEIGAAIVRVLSAAFRRVTILMGNHDDWFTKYFRGHADAEWLYSRLFNTAGNVEWTHFQQCEVKSGGKTFRVLHGANYSGRNPLTVGKDLAAKFGCGIVMGHQHHHESGFDKSGDHQVVCMGGMYDPSKLAYIHESPRTNPVPTPGYAIIKDGWVQDYAKRKAPEW